MDMDRKEFFRRLTVDLSLYTTFNTLRDALFNALAIDPRNPMDESILQDIISKRTEDQTMSDEQVSLIKTFVESGDTYRLYEVSTSCNIDLLYIVNMNKTDIPKGGIIGSDVAIAAHQMAIGLTPESGDPRVDFSVICLAEKHEMMTPVKYPKIIKHELVHAAINHIAADNSDIRNFVRYAKTACEGAASNEPTFVDYEFIELVCNIVPYLSVPMKKENGIDKFMEDAHTIFGYDEEDPVLTEGVAIITEVQQEAEETKE